MLLAVYCYFYSEKALYLVPSILLKKRMKKHIHCKNSNAHLSALASHVTENTGHSPNIHSVQIADKETRKDFRKIKEAAYIRKYKTRVMIHEQ